MNERIKATTFEEYNKAIEIIKLRKITKTQFVREGEELFIEIIEEKPL